MLAERRRQVPQAKIAEVRDPRPVLRRRSFADTSGRSVFPRMSLYAYCVRAFVTLSEVTGTVSGHRVGYGRVSSRDQNSDAQRDALAAAGCEEVFIDKASGKLVRRPELDRALLVARG